MKQHKIKLILFALVAVIQLLVPLYMVWLWEDTLLTGNQYQWQTAPVDPYDALRGRYLDLRFKETQGSVAVNEHLSYGQTAYATIGVNNHGFAYINSVSATKPETGDYVEVKTLAMSGDKVHVTVPFKRYYIRENLAPLAETAYHKSGGKDGSVTVRIKNGRGVVEQLYIGNQTLDEYLRSEDEK